MSRILWLALGMTGCNGCGDGANTTTDPAVELETVCALPSGTGDVGWGDANNDGQVDISDSVRTLRSLLDGGAPVACEAAQDAAYRDDLLDVGDAQGLLYVLFVGNAELPDDSPECDTVTALEDAPCGALLLSLDGATEVTADSAGAAVSFDVAVSLRAPDLSVQAWSFGVEASGCTIAAASETGTASADLRLDSAGRRDVGWLRTDVADDHLVSSAMLSWLNDVVLPPQEAAWTLLQLTVQATAPDSGCTTCTLGLASGLEGDGLPVATMVSVGGRSMPIPTAGLEVQVCAP